MSLPLLWTAFVLPWGAIDPAAPCAMASFQEAPAAPAPAKAGFETLLPGDAMFFVGIDDLPELEQAWAASPWGLLFNDAGAEGLRKSFKQALAELGAQTEKELGVDLVETYGLLDGRVAVTLWANPELTAPGGKDESAGCLLLDAGEHAATLKERVLKLFAHHFEGGRAVLKSETEGDIEIAVIEDHPAEGEGKVAARLAARGRTFIGGVGTDSRKDGRDFRQVLAALGGDVKAPLALQANFKETVAAQPGGIKAWIDTGRMAQSARELAKQVERDPDAPAFADSSMVEMLGLDEFRALAIRLWLGPGEMRLDAHQAWTGKGRLATLLDAFFAGGDHTLLKFVPTTAENAFSFHLDLVKGFAAAEVASREMTGEPLFSDDAGGGGDPAAGATGEERAPFNPKKDLIDHLDGRLAIFVAPVDETEAMPYLQSSKPMNFCLMFGVKNAEALRGSIDKLLRSEGLYPARRRSEFQGFEVYSLSVMPISFQYAILDDLFVISMAPSLLQDALRRKSDPELPCLLKDASFARQLEAMSPAHALLFFSRPAVSMSAALEQAATLSKMQDLPPPPDMEGAPEGAGEGEQMPPTMPVLPEPLKKVLDDLVNALLGLDPALAMKHLPSGSLVGLGVDQAGMHFEGVSR